MNKRIASLVWTAIPGLVHPGYAQVSIVMCSDPQAGWSCNCLIKAGQSITRAPTRIVDMLTATDGGRARKTTLGDCSRGPPSAGYAKTSGISSGAGDSIEFSRSAIPSFVWPKS